MKHVKRCKIDTIVWFMAARGECRGGTREKGTKKEKRGKNER